MGVDFDAGAVFPLNGHKRCFLTTPISLLILDNVRLPSPNCFVMTYNIYNSISLVPDSKMDNKDVSSMGNK